MIPRLGFTGKLIAGTVSLVVGFVLAASGALYLLIDRAAERQIARDLEAGRRSYQNYMTLKWRSLRENAAFLSRSSLLNASVSTGDPATVEDTLSHMDVVDVLSFVWVGDGDGHPLGSTPDAPALSQEVVQSAVARAIDGESSDGIWRVGGDLFLVAAAPLAERGGLVGVLAVGERLDEGAVSLIAEVTGRDVLLIHGEQVMACAWRNESTGEVTAAENGILFAKLSGRSLRDRGLPLRLKLAGRPRVGLAIPMREEGGDGLLVLSNDVEEVTGLYDAAYGWLLACGLTIGAMGVVLSLRVSAKLARPLGELIRASNEMAEGDLGARVSIGSRDEVGRLADSFNRMATTIEKLVSDVSEQAHRAEAANRAKDKLLASMSHELRTPVSSVKAATEILLNFGDECSQEERREFLEVLDEQTERLARMISQVLDYALVESGQMRWNVDAFCLGNLVTALAESHREYAGTRGVEISVRATGELPCHGDQRRIHQALDNLVDNACKHTAPNTEVSIEVSRIGDELTVRIADRGAGIPGDDAKRAVFERFYQHGEILTGKPAGTGLGLTISREIVAAHDGELWCEDHPGGGAVFVVRLPGVRRLPQPTASPEISPTGP